jgi:maltose-binding protein MalE
MKFIKTKKGISLLAVIAVVAIAAVGAYAFFSSTGTGTGTATVGSSTPFTIASLAPTGGPLYPDHAIGGSNLETVAYKVTNPSAGAEKLNQVVVSIANSNGSAWSSQTNTGKPACTAADFSVDGQAVGSPDTDTTLQADLNGGVTTPSANVTVEMIDNGLNQDNCAGLTVPLYFSAS